MVDPQAGAPPSAVTPPSDRTSSIPVPVGVSVPTRTTSVSECGMSMSGSSAAAPAATTWSPAVATAVKAPPPAAGTSRAATPAQPNVASSAPDGVRRATTPKATAGGRSGDALAAPARTGRPDASIVRASRKRLAPIRMVVDPPEPKVVSIVPVVVSRLTAVVIEPSGPAGPAITARPAPSRASGPTTVDAIEAGSTRPPLPKVGSSEPEGVKRATSGEGVSSASAVVPPTTTAPSAWMATEESSACSWPNVVVVMPPLPNEASSVPPGVRRATRAADAWLPLRPTTTAVPSALTARPVAASMPPAVTVVLPPVP